MQLIALCSYIVSTVLFTNPSSLCLSLFLSHSQYVSTLTILTATTRWFKYDRDYLCVNKSQFFPVIFEPPYIYRHLNI